MEGTSSLLRSGSISSTAKMRDKLGELSRRTGRCFPILLEQVVHNGRPTGDCISSNDAPLLLNEIAEAPTGHHTG